MTPPAAAEETVAALPEGIGRIEVLAGARHFPWMDDPDRWVALLVEFVPEVTDREHVEPAP